uniref:Uncharacterized protein n=1 Tax=viral metagenome TaxID=1070528 RepID=A0A6M3XEH0_9ZZZZ
MCEDNYRQMLEEYRGIVNELFMLILDRNEQKSIEIANLRMKIETRSHDRKVKEI